MTDLIMAALAALVLGVDAWLWLTGRPTYSQRLRAFGVAWPPLKAVYLALAAFLYWHFWGS